MLQKERLLDLERSQAAAISESRPGRRDPLALWSFAASGPGKYWVPAALLALAVFPWVLTSSYWLSVLIDVFIFGIFALSYDLIMGYTGILSFGHALFFGTGAYAVGLLLVRFHWPLWGAVGAGLALSLVFGVILGTLSLRVHGVYFAMVTLAFAELGYILVQKASRLTGGADGLTGIPVPPWLADRRAFYYLALGLLVATYLFLRRVVDSPVGRTLVAIRENETRAAMVGYNVFAYKLLALALGGFLAALAGMVNALFYNYVSPMVLGIDNTVNVLLMTIIGGAGTLLGPVLGAGVVRILGTVLSSFFKRWLLIFGIIYILIVMFLPHGVMGALSRRRVEAR